SLSKSYGLQSLGIEFAIISDDLREVIIQPEIPLISMKLALESLSDIGLIHAKREIQNIISQRENLKKHLRSSNEIKHVYDSLTDFIAFQPKKVESFIKKLSSCGVKFSQHDKLLQVPVVQSNNILAGLDIAYESKKDRSTTVARKTKETEIR